MVFEVKGYAPKIAALADKRPLWAGLRLPRRRYRMMGLMSLDHRNTDNDN